MKKLITLLFFFSVMQSYSQELPFGMDWYLYELNVSGQDIPIPNLDEVNYVQANFYGGSPDTFETGACNSCEGEVVVDLSFWTIEFYLSCTLSDCINPDNDFFDNAYSNFFQNSNSYNYEIGWIDGPPGPDEIVLTIIAQNGDYVTYTDLQPLSTADFPKVEFTVFPNPAESEFYISSNSNLDNFSVLIYDIEGKLILSEEKIISNQLINIQNLNNGIYFVTIKGASGNVSVKKLIKK